METYPILYTEKEGGDWKPWTFGPFDAIKELVTDGVSVRKVNGITVHSFLLAIRWDYYSGLECALYDAAIPFELVQ